MSKCDHLNAKFQIVIERWLDAQIQTSEISDAVNISRDTPQRIRVQVVCPDCGLTRAYAAYNPVIYAEIFGADPRSADRWPTWLLNRLIPLRARNAAVQEACLACNVPPVDHPSWPHVVTDYGHGWQLVEQAA
jgi:hypothetical protein